MATQVNRLVGHYAVCHVGATAGTTSGFLVAHLLDWEVTITTDFANATGHGDRWDIPVIVKQSWVGRCSGFMTELSRITFLSQWVVGANGAYTDQVARTFIGYNIGDADAEADDSNVLFRGSCYPTGATIRLPNKAMSNQEIGFRGIGSPLFIGPGI